MALNCELLKLRTGRTWWLLLLGGVAMCAVTSIGFAGEAGAATVTGGPSAHTAAVARTWMMLLLFAALLGASVVTREYAAGTLARTVLTTGSRGRVFLAKLVIGTGAGLAFGLVGAIGAVVSPAAVMHDPRYPVEWSAEATWTTVGIVASCVLAAAWGVAVGWIVRSATGAALAVVVVVLLVDPGLQRLVPQAASYLFTIALSSIYLDDKPSLLGVPAAVAVALCWIAGLTSWGLWSWRHRDLAA